jgi:hypothetical protein
MRVFGGRFCGLVPAVLCADKDRKPNLGERRARNRRMGDNYRLRSMVPGSGCPEFAAIETSMTPVATQEGEIPFSAYNSVGWRQLVEQLHRTSTLPEWHREHGRHAIHAKVTLCKFLALGRLRWTVRGRALGEKAATLSCCE